MKTIGIIGAGQMGSGIAHVCALAGLNVLLHDINDDAIQSGLATISGNLARQVSSDKITDAERHAALERLTAAPDPQALGAADMVIEAATEDEAVKGKIYQNIIPHLRDDTIIATNTSSIPITRLATTTDRPGLFIGMHFIWHQDHNEICTSNCFSHFLNFKASVLGFFP